MFFPVERPATFFSDFGQPRSGGRTHEGTDIFAPEGARLFAAEAGIVRAAPNALGGPFAFVLLGESGTRYYYAHGQSLEVDDGARVAGGQELGEVGTLGNAKGTRAHLHFEIHPGGGAPIDPYARLRAAETSPAESYDVTRIVVGAAVALAVFFGVRQVLK